MMLRMYGPFGPSKDNLSDEGMEGISARMVPVASVGADMESSNDDDSDDYTSPSGIEDM